jgi:hypothetical protein
MNRPFLDLLLFSFSVILIVKFNDLSEKLENSFFVYFVVFLCVHRFLCQELILVVQSEVHLSHQQIG